MIEEVLGGRYEVRGQIGSGGMARVYRAFDRTLKREVAVKILAGDTLEEAASVERFRREARAAGNLSHPNIIGVYDWGETSTVDAHGHPTYYMVMELVSGQNLKEILDDRGLLPEAEALDIAAQVAAALQAAHEHSVIHRDIKPQNILVGNAGQVKVTDFGIARAAGLTQLTATDVICGTPYYLSPEQALRQALDSRSDIYGLGVVLFEMLTGEELFSGSPLEVAMRHVQEEPRSPRALQPGISATTEAIVRKALAKNPADRFQSAADMHRALRQARNRLAIADPPRPQPAARRARAPGAAGLTTQWRLRQPDAQPFLRKDGSPANPWLRVLPVILLVVVFTGVLAFLNARNSGSHSSRNAAPTTSVPAPTPHPTAHPTPRPAAQPSATASTQSTAVQPTATSVPPSPASPTAPPATGPTSSLAVAASSAGSPVAAIESFYRLVSEHRFTDAAALWTPRLQSQDNPATYINQRFAGTRSVSVLSVTLNSADPANGTAVVGVQLLETTATGAHLTWTGTWSLVLGPSGWLLDRPNFGASSQVLRSIKPGEGKHDPAKPGHNGGDKGNGD